MADDKDLGQDEGFDESDELEVVEFEDEEGVLHTAAILAVIAVEGQDYAVLAPVHQLEDETEELEIFLFEYGEDEDGNECFSYIEDEERFDMVKEAAATLLEEGDDDEDGADYVN